MTAEPGCAPVARAASLCAVCSLNFAMMSVSPDDRRISNVAPTPKGAAFVRRFAPVHDEKEAAALAVLSTSEQRTLLKLLDKLRSTKAS